MEYRHDIPLIPLMAASGQHHGTLAGTLFITGFAAVLTVALLSLATVMNRGGEQSMEDNQSPR